MSLASILNGPSGPAGQVASVPTSAESPASAASPSADGSVVSSEDSAPAPQPSNGAETQRYLESLASSDAPLPRHHTALPTLQRHPYSSTLEPADSEDLRGLDLNAYSDVWSGPLNAYILATRQRERRAKLDFEAAEARSHFALATRITAWAGGRAEALLSAQEAERVKAQQAEEEAKRAELSRLDDEARRLEQVKAEEERRHRKNVLQQASRERAREKKRLEAEAKREGEANARRAGAGADPDAIPDGSALAVPHHHYHGGSGSSVNGNSNGNGTMPGWASVAGSSVNGDGASEAGGASATALPSGLPLLDIAEPEVDELAASPDLRPATNPAVRALGLAPPGSAAAASGKRKGSRSSSAGGKRKRGNGEGSSPAGTPAPQPHPQAHPYPHPQSSHIHPHSHPAYPGLALGYHAQSPYGPSGAPLGIGMGISVGLEAAESGVHRSPYDTGSGPATAAARSSSSSSAAELQAATGAVPLEPAAQAPTASTSTAPTPAHGAVAPAAPAPAAPAEPVKAWGWDRPYGAYPYHGLPERLEMSLPVRKRIIANPRALAEKRWSVIDEHHRAVWTQIARKEVPKLQKLQQSSTGSRQLFSKRLSTLVSREARRILGRTKTPKEVQAKAKRAMRELLVFYRGNEKRERESKKKAEQEALARAKKEEEMREAKRQARKLNFLITQTELYSHFVGNKIKTKEAEESADTAGDMAAVKAIEGPDVPKEVEPLDEADAVDGAELADIDFDDEDESNLRAHAARNAQAALDAAKQRAKAFDEAVAEQNELAGGKGDQLVSGINIDRDDLNFQNPTMAGDLQVKQPDMLMAELKEYQLKGLTWLANLYEQGINGILADEMGLGKTVQSISLMAYLAEKHDIWGPFLVIAPASTLHNWQQEISRFVPTLKALPYWGNTKDRAVLRKFWNRKSLRYDKDSPFHVLVTSYQLVVQDEKYFQRVKWQYMILDEAQAIKSSGSTRWRTLLGFHCRNRLLLTGTPIQNSMTELWALLHFIMPQLFDSHAEFSEWFSKDIESGADKAGGMNEHQLRRLHMILKPFMLRRIKKNVQNELGDKIEIDVPCGLTPRQKVMYSRLRENISVADLIQRATSLSTDDTAVKRLMNLIMQFRKVCNHPELFERADVVAPLSFGAFNSTANPSRSGDLVECPYSLHSLIELWIPKLLYRGGGMRKVPGPQSSAGSDSLHLERLMNVWSPDHLRAAAPDGGAAPSWARIADLSVGEVHRLATGPTAQRVSWQLAREDRAVELAQASRLGPESAAGSLRSLVIPWGSAALPFSRARPVQGLLPPLGGVSILLREESRMNRSDFHFFPNTTVAPAIDLVCSDRAFADEQTRERFDPLATSALFGMSRFSLESEESHRRFESAFPGLSPRGVIGASTRAQLPRSVMHVPQLEKLILDSGKLSKLDSLLKGLKAGGHRVLVYFQMTKMIDLMEEFLSFRQYKYLRLDGGSTISERRDMVTDWQTNPDLFIFLLSTRAGGLGINLTAADTVIFYDSDWNPSNDQQAMDRAHRLGQKRQVTVYRLVTIGTIDERILKLARTKKTVQDAVVGSSSQAVGGDVAKTNEVASLLLEDDELEAGIRAQQAKREALKTKQIENGHRGVRIREERKAERLASATQSVRSSPAPWADPEDDDEAFGFFSNLPTRGPGDAEDELAAAAAKGGGEGAPLGPATAAAGVAAPGKKGGPKKRKAPAEGGGTSRKKKSKLAE